MVCIATSGVKIQNQKKAEFFTNDNLEFVIGRSHVLEGVGMDVH